MSTSSWLTLSSYAPSTRLLYTKAVRKYLYWVKSCGTDPSSVSTDWLLHSYILHLYSTHQGKTLAQHTVFGVTMLDPSVKGSLPSSLRALRGWSKLQPSVSYLPLPRNAMYALALHLYLNESIIAAVAVLVGFFGMFRIGELVNLRKEDVSCFSSWSLVSSDSKSLTFTVKKVPMTVSFRLRKTKTGPNKFAEFSNVAVATLLSRLLTNTAAGAYVFPFTEAKFRFMFKSAVVSLGLPSSIVPHSLRHGGATDLHIRGVSVEDILIKGRWASTKSARTYIQTSRALLLAASIPESVSSVGARVACDLVKVFASQ